MSDKAPLAAIPPAPLEVVPAAVAPLPPEPLKIEPLEIVAKKRPSIDVVGPEIDAIRAFQSGSIEALDTKAGVILGFSGAILAVLVTAQNTDFTLWAMPGFLLLAVSVILCVWALRPRDFYFNPKPSVLFKDYMFLDPYAPIVGAKEKILADKVEAYSQNEVTLKQKACVVEWAAICLGAGVIFISGFTLGRKIMTNEKTSAATISPTAPIAQPNPDASNTIKKGVGLRPR